MRKIFSPVKLPAPYSFSLTIRVYLEGGEEGKEPGLAGAEEGLREDRRTRDQAPEHRVLRVLERKFMSCSQCQELGQQASWLLIGCTQVNNQLEVKVS